MTRAKVWKPSNYTRGYRYDELTGLGHQLTTSGYHVWHNPRVEIDEEAHTATFAQMIREAGGQIETLDDGTIVMKRLCFYEGGYQTTKVVGKYKERSTMLTYYRAWLDRYNTPLSPTER